MEDKLAQRLSGTHEHLMAEALAKSRRAALMGPGLASQTGMTRKGSYREYAVG